MLDWNLLLLLVLLCLFVLVCLVKYYWLLDSFVIGLFVLCVVGFVFCFSC